MADSSRENPAPWSQPYKTVELERFKVAMEQVISRRDLRFAITPHIELGERLMFAANDLLFRIEQEVFGRQAYVTISYPATLWQHVKKVLGLKYEATVHKIDGQILFPDINVPGHRACVIVREQCDSLTVPTKAL